MGKVRLRLFTPELSKEPRGYLKLGFLDIGPGNETGPKKWESFCFEGEKYQNLKFWILGFVVDEFRRCKLKNNIIF